VGREDIFKILIKNKEAFAHINSIDIPNISFDPHSVNVSMLRNFKVEFT